MNLLYLIFFGVLLVAGAHDGDWTKGEALIAITVYAGCIDIKDAIRGGKP